MNTKQILQHNEREQRKRDNECNKQLTRIADLLQTLVNVTTQKENS